MTSQPFTGTLATAAGLGATDGQRRAHSRGDPVEGEGFGELRSTATFGPAWIDVDNNGCDTRNDTLARDLHSPALNGSCIVTAGTLTDRPVAPASISGAASARQISSRSTLSCHL